MKTKGILLLIAFISGLTGGFLLSPTGPGEGASSTTTGGASIDTERDKRKLLGSIAPDVAVQAPASYITGMQAILARIDATPITAFDQLAEKLAARNPEGSLALHYLASVWGANDPAGALAYAEKLPPDAVEGYVLEIARAAAATHGIDALALIPEIEMRYAQSAFAAEVMLDLVATEPEAAFAAYADNPELALSDFFANQLLERLARNDAAMALALGEQYLNDSVIESQLDSLGAHFGKQDPDAAYAWALAQDNPQSRTAALSGVTIGIAQDDPAQAAALIAGMENSTMRTLLARGMIHLWSGNPETALTWIEGELAGHERNIVLGQLIKSMAGQDPLAARGLIGQLDAGVQQDSAIYAVSQQLAASDAIGTLEWIGELDNAFARETATPQVFQTWAGVDPLAATTYLAENGTAELKDKLGYEMTMHLINENPDMAAQWALSNMGPESNRKDALAQVIDVLSTRDPATALNLYENTIPESERSLSMVYDIANGWASVDTQAAANWADSQEDTTIRRGAAMNVLEVWVQQDSYTAAQWVDSQPEGPIRDALARSLVFHIQHREPASAFAWALSVEDPQGRMEDLMQVTRTWASYDRNAAEQALTTNNNLSLEEKRTLETVLEEM